MENNMIYVDYNLCVGCGTCEMVCSLTHEGVCAPSLSRMRIVRFTRDAVNVPVTCAFCEKPPCRNICPAGAISKDPVKGDVSIDVSACIGCRQCSTVCPFGHINFNPQKGVAFKCDLCGGDPQCVQFCWTNALQFLPPQYPADLRRDNFAQRLLMGAEPKPHSHT